MCMIFRLRSNKAKEKTMSMQYLETILLHGIPISKAFIQYSSSLTHCCYNLDVHATNGCVALHINSVLANRKAKVPIYNYNLQAQS